MNITDVGHLTSDADTGEDKMEKGARRTGKTAWEIAKLYTDAFVDDMARLNIEMPSVLCRATDHIQDQIEFIADIEKNGFTYRTSDGIYFNTSLQPELWISRPPRQGRAGSGQAGRAWREESITDFALWKFSAPRESAADGMGEPMGNRVSGLAHRMLGDGAEISRRFLRHSLRRRRSHPGPSHQRDRADRGARRNPARQLLDAWLLSAVERRQDGEIRGRIPALQLLVDRGYDPLAYRYLCLTAHYRSQLNFTWDALDAAAKGLERLRNGVFVLGEIDVDAAEADAGYLERFTAEINDDLNLPRALALAWEVLRSGLDAATKKATLLAFDRVFGLGLGAWVPRTESIPEPIAVLAAARATARQSRQWAEADRLRAEIQAAGWEMEDRPDGYVLRRVAGS
jgi:cysteinyl-tRNA synthetase